MSAANTQKPAATQAEADMHIAKKGDKTLIRTSIVERSPGVPETLISEHIKWS